MSDPNSRGWSLLSATDPSFLELILLFWSGLTLGNGDSNGSPILLLLKVTKYNLDLFGHYISGQLVVKWQDKIQYRHIQYLFTEIFFLVSWQIDLLLLESYLTSIYHTIIYHTLCTMYMEYLVWHCHLFRNSINSMWHTTTYM